MAEFEHALFLLLLLVGVLNARPSHSNLSLGLIASGFLLALVPPAVQVPLPWELILGLAIPLLLWQNGRRLVSAGWRGNPVELVIFVIAVLGLGLVAWLNPDLGWTGSILFGLLAASMIWRAVEPDVETSHLSQLGPLTVVFLLAETAPAVETPTRYIGGLFSGAAVGIAVAFLASRLSQRVSPSARRWIAIGQVYLAYWLALAIDSSGVAAALLSVAVYLESGLRNGLWGTGELDPAPLNSRPVYALALLLLLFLGWQTHQPLGLTVVIEVALSLAIGMGVAWLGQRLAFFWFGQLSPLQVGARVALLLFPALLLWPRTTLLQPLPLAIAVGVAALVSVVTANSLVPLMALQDPEQEMEGEDVDPAVLLDQLARDESHQDRSKDKA